MDVIAFWIIYLGVIVISIFFVIKSGIDLFKVSIPMVVFWSVMGFAYLGYPAIYFKVVPYYVSIGITNEFIIWKMFLLSSFVWIQFFAGFFIAGTLLKTKNSQICISYHPLKNNVSLLAFIVVFLISIAVLIIYLNKVPGIALVETMKGVHASQVAYIRSEMTNNFPKYHRYSLFFKTILPFLSYVAWSQYLFTKKKLWLIMFFITFVCCSFALLMDAQKGPFIWYLIALMFIYFIFRNIKIRFKTIIKLASVFLLLLVIMYSAFMGTQFDLGTVANPIRRATTGQIIPLYWYIDMFPEKADFVGGRTFPNPAGILPWEPYRYTVEVMNYVEGERGGVVGSAPTAFFGELWVNFGIWLNILLPMYVGMLILLIHKIFTLRPLNSLGLAVMVWLALDLKNLASTGISMFFIPIGLFVILIIAALLYYFPRIKV